MPPKPPPPLGRYEGTVREVCGHDLTTEKPWLAVGVDFDDVAWNVPIPVDFAHREKLLPGARVAIEFHLSASPTP